MTTWRVQPFPNQSPGPGRSPAYLFASCCSKSPHCLKSSPQAAMILNQTESTSGSSTWNANVYSTNTVSFIKMLSIHAVAGFWESPGPPDETFHPPESIAEGKRQPL